MINVYLCTHIHSLNKGKDMKKSLLIVFAMAFSAISYAQKIEFQQAQTRVIEPIQDAYIRPMVADLKILKNERQKYAPRYYYQNIKLADLTEEHLKQAKILATYDCAIQEDADVIVGATYFITNHKDADGKISEYGVDIIVNGYPAKYVDWHKFGEKTTDKDWIPYLLDGTRARALGGSDKKDEAVSAGSK